MQDNALGFRRTFVKKDRSKRAAITTEIVTSGIFLLLVSVTINTVNNNIDLFNRITSLNVYQMIERDGDCNVFVNGFQEEMRICPDDLEVKTNGN